MSLRFKVHRFFHQLMIYAFVAVRFGVVVIELKIIKETNMKVYKIMLVGTHFH